MKKQIPLFTKLLIALACWLVFLFIDISKKGIDTSRIEFYYFYYFPGFVIWFVSTIPLYNLFKKTGNWPLPKRITFVFLLGIAVGILKTFIAWTVFYFAVVPSEAPFFNFFQTVRPFFYVEASIIAWVMLLIFYGIELYENFKEKTLEANKLESQLANAQLQTLKMQLHPHFLFNVHNTIAMLIRDNQNTKALEMLLGVSELLRLTLTKTDNQLVTLNEEMDWIRRYLDLEKVRFEDSLIIQIDGFEEIKNLKVPNLILQPIVENAFKHGINRNIGGSILRISFSTTDHQMRIEVFNSGPRLPEKWSMDHVHGIGLKNTISRLEKLYGDDFDFTLTNEVDGVVASLKIPKG